MRQSLPKRPTNMRGTGCERCSSEQGAPCWLHREAGQERADKGGEAQAAQGSRPSCQAAGEAPHVSKSPPERCSRTHLPSPPAPSPLPLCQAHSCPSLCTGLPSTRNAFPPPVPLTPRQTATYLSGLSSNPPLL